MADQANGGAPDDAPARTWPIVVKLKIPIEFGQETIRQLELRRGRMGDLKGIRLSGTDLPADSLMLVASRMSGQPLGVIERLDADDAGAVSEVVLDFFARSLSTGTKD